VKRESVSYYPQIDGQNPLAISRLHRLTPIFKPWVLGLRKSVKSADSKGFPLRFPVFATGDKEKIVFKIEEETEIYQ
jgi:hypothetical protein